MLEPVRVLQVFAQMNRGGAETMIMNLYRNFDRTRVQFDFVVHTDDKCAFDDEIAKLGGRIFRVPHYTGKNHIEYLNTWRKFAKSHPEYKIIHGHVRSTAAIYLKVFKRSGALTIAHSHSTASRGNKVEQFIKSIMQLPIRYMADYLFACSDEAGKWLYGKNTIAKDNYRLVRNAIDAEEYIYSDKKRNEIRKSLNIGDKFVIGHIGSFTYPKNHDFLIDIFKEIQKRNKNAVLLLVGDGNIREAIRKKVSKLDLTNNVIFAGLRFDIPELLQAIDVFVFPSIFEGLPVTLIEAQASGLKCIISDVITKEVEITDQIQFISLSQPAEYWAEQVLNHSDGYERTNNYKKSCRARYDIIENAQKLEDFYLKEYKKLQSS